MIYWQLQNFLKLMKDKIINLVSFTNSKMDKKETTLKHTITNCWKPSTTRKLLKPEEGWKFVKKSNHLRLTAKSSSTAQARRHWKAQGKHCQSRTLPHSDTVRKKRKKEKTQMFITSWPEHQRVFSRQKDRPHGRLRWAQTSARGSPVSDSKDKPPSAMPCRAWNTYRNKTLEWW